jgi:hypothetical protein
MSAIDVIILIPLIPLLLVWYLPWEGWVWDKLPKPWRKFAGPYLLYVSFVFWHFELVWWSTLCVFGMAVGLSVWAILQELNTRREK